MKKLEYKNSKINWPELDWQTCNQLWFVPFLIFLFKERDLVRYNDTSQHILTCQLRSRIPFESMIADVIDTSRQITPAVYQNFVRKTDIETNTCYRVSYSKIWSNHVFDHDHVNHVFSGYAILLPNRLRSFDSKQRENEQITMTFSTFYTRWLGSLMTSKKCKF